MPGDPTPVEIEVKLRASRQAFAVLAEASAFGPWRVVEQTEIRLRDTYFDTPDHSLARQRCTLRIRSLDGDAIGELTLKGPSGNAPSGPSDADENTGRMSEGIMARTELTAVMPVGVPVHEWGAVVEARPVIDALRARGIAYPGDLADGAVLVNPRRNLRLRRTTNNVHPIDYAEVVLSLDEVRLEGHRYVRRYVEIELVRGAPETVTEVSALLVGMTRLRPARSGKVQAARAWLARLRPTPSTQCL